MNEYSTSVQSIKDEISKKQNQIYSLKCNLFYYHNRECIFTIYEPETN